MHTWAHSSIKLFYSYHHCQFHLHSKNKIQMVLIMHIWCDEIVAPPGQRVVFFAFTVVFLFKNDIHAIHPTSYSTWVALFNLSKTINKCGRFPWGPRHKKASHVAWRHKRFLATGPAWPGYIKRMPISTNWFIPVCLSCELFWQTFVLLMTFEFGSWNDNRHCVTSSRTDTLPTMYQVDPFLYLLATSSAGEAALLNLRATCGRNLVL